MENENVKNITTDELAVMIQNSFAATDKKIETGFKAVNERLDKLQSERIEKLEQRMKRIEDALVIK